MAILIIIAGFVIFETLQFAISILFLQFCIFYHFHNFSPCSQFSTIFTILSILPLAVFKNILRMMLRKLKLIIHILRSPKFVSQKPKKGCFFTKSMDKKITFYWSDHDIRHPTFPRLQLFVHFAISIVVAILDIFTYFLHP